MQMRIQLQPAYVLFSQPFQNTSVMVDFFTLEFGRVRAVAKGARREKSKYRSLLQPFHPLLINFSGRGDVKTIGNIESGHASFSLVGDRLFSGLYLNEVLCRLLQNFQEHQSLYRSYQNTLVALQGFEDIEIILRKFELKLLAELGYAVDFRKDYLTGEPIEKNKRYRFTPDAGFELERSLETGDYIENLFEGSDLIALGEFSFNEKSVVRAAKRLLRLALRIHLGDKPLQSRSLFINVR